MIGKVIRYVRKTKGLNQQQLADILKISRTTLGHYETGIRQPTFEMIEKILNQCGYTIQFKSDEETFEAKDLKRKD